MHVESIKYVLQEHHVYPERAHSISRIERHLGHLSISTADGPTQQNILCIGTKELRVSVAPVIDPLAPAGIKDLLGFRIRSVFLSACRIANIEGRAGLRSTHEDGDPGVAVGRPENVTRCEAAGGNGSCRGFFIGPACAVLVGELGCTCHYFGKNEPREPRGMSSSRTRGGNLVSLPSNYLPSRSKVPWQYRGFGHW